MQHHRRPCARGSLVSQCCRPHWGHTQQLSPQSGSEPQCSAIAEAAWQTPLLSVFTAPQRNCETHTPLVRAQKLLKAAIGRRPRRPSPWCTGRPILPLALGRGNNGIRSARAAVSSSICCSMARSFSCCLANEDLAASARRTARVCQASAHRTAS